MRGLYYFVKNQGRVVVGEVCEKFQIKMIRGLEHVCSGFSIMNTKRGMRNGHIHRTSEYYHKMQHAEISLTGNYEFYYAAGLIAKIIRG